MTHHPKYIKISGRMTHLVEEKLELLVCQVDASLLKTVQLEMFEAEDIENPDLLYFVWIERLAWHEQSVDAIDDPTKEATVKSLGHGVTCICQELTFMRQHHNVINDMNVLYSTCCCDHIPITVDISIGCIPVLESVDNDNINLSVIWSKLSAADKETYARDIDVHLNAVKLPVEAICCKDTECSNEQHFEALNVLYEGLVGVLTEASKKLSNRRRKNSNQPGWNDHVADLHKDARECFVMWCNNGKPRQGWIFDLMHQTRSHFKYALRTVKNNENVLRKESLANKLSCSNPNKFWQEIRTMTSKSTSLPSSMEGVTGKHAISVLWKSHFGRLLNVIQDDGLCDISCDTVYSDDIHVSTNEVVLAVQALGANKASGLDGIVAEHLLYSSERWCTMLAKCLSGLFVHVFLPDSMLAVVLVPIIKDKTGRIDRINNYRPIALASVVSKVVERILLDRISHFLETCQISSDSSQVLVLILVYMY